MLNCQLVNYAPVLNFTVIQILRGTNAMEYKHLKIPEPVHANLRVICVLLKVDLQDAAEAAIRTWISQMVTSGRVPGFVDQPATEQEILNLIPRLQPPKTGARKTAVNDPSERHK